MALAQRATQRLLTMSGQEPRGCFDCGSAGRTRYPAVSRSSWRASSGSSPASLGLASQRAASVTVTVQVVEAGVSLAGKLG